MEEVRKEPRTDQGRIRVNANKWIPEPFTLRFCKFHINIWVRAYCVSWFQALGRSRKFSGPHSLTNNHIHDHPNRRLGRPLPPKIPLRKPLRVHPQTRLWCFGGPGGSGKGRSRAQLLLTLAPAPAWTLLQGQVGRECEPRSCNRGRREAGYLWAPDIRRTHPSPAPPRSSNPRLPAPGPPPASAPGTTSPCSLFPSSAVRTGPSRQLTHPVRPNTARNPFCTARSPWHLCQCQSSTRTRRRDCAPLANQKRRKARPGAYN